MFQVLHVLMKWANDLKSGLLEPKDVVYLRECLLKRETAELPTKQDKWVSLHPTFGLVCWCDNMELWTQFKHSDNIYVLYFGELSRDEKEVLPAEISRLMKELGVPSLSEVITREAYSMVRLTVEKKLLLVNWVLPYAQRYIYKLHPDKYIQLKQSGFSNVCDLWIVVVENLFYRHTFKGCDKGIK
ncbi:hypothetical protein IFM89_027157 [Coptis chinensis]|uniref:Uncharacterized protein n=1 Tax=Coptis chinensis TaxID=261450 RepID=A0A835HYS6_9MAGN|nr:hypothetical protein IFM89_027157 [Coptis chinensis]